MGQACKCDEKWCHMQRRPYADPNVLQLPLEQWRRSAQSPPLAHVRQWGPPMQEWSQAPLHVDVVEWCPDVEDEDVGEALAEALWLLPMFLATQAGTMICHRLRSGVCICVKRRKLR